MVFLEYVKNNNFLLLDGAMGTELTKRNVMGNFRNNIDNKDIVREIHESYIEAGSRAIITNTFSMNRLYLKDKDTDIDIELINKNGVKIAQEAAGEDVFVLGDIGPTGKLLQPYGDYEEEEFIEAFAEKARYLSESNVDAIIIETMVDLREAVCALKACKKVSDLPVIVSISFNQVDKGGKTIMGNSTEEVVQKLTKEKADIIGTNCGSLDPMQISKIVEIMKSHTDIPIMVEPNAGQPKLQGDETIYDMQPKAFTEGILACIEAGANIIGGCCGTTPAHIRDLYQTLIQKL